MKPFGAGCPWGPVSTDLVSLPLGASTSLQILVIVLIWFKQFQLWFRNKAIPKAWGRGNFREGGQDHALSLSHAEFEMSVKYPRGDSGRNLDTWAGVLQRELGL